MTPAVLSASMVLGRHLVPASGPWSAEARSLLGSMFSHRPGVRLVDLMLIRGGPDLGVLVGTRGRPLGTLFTVVGAGFISAVAGALIDRLFDIPGVAAVLVYVALVVSYELLGSKFANSENLKFRFALGFCGLHSLAFLGGAVWNLYRDGPLGPTSVCLLMSVLYCLGAISVRCAHYLAVASTPRRPVGAVMAFPQDLNGSAGTSLAPIENGAQINLIFRHRRQYLTRTVRTL